jgi:hypothetical protein
LRRAVIAIGLLLVALGVIWPWLVGIGLGRLPGDMRVQRPGFSFFFPLGSSLLVSVVLSLLLTLIVWLFRR